MQAHGIQSQYCTHRMQFCQLPQARLFVRLFATLVLLSLCGAGALGAKPPRANRAERLRWHITETDSFRVLNYGTHPVATALCTSCETLRRQLLAQWLGDAAAGWTPKCDLILHPSDASYDREVGPGGKSTIASALVDRHSTRVSLRRIDVRASRVDWLEVALAHELTHVILADRFDPEVLPRWLDEGMAILADSAAKRKQHVIRAGHDFAQGAHFALAELLLLDGYPPPQRWGTFYDQSAALVEFLVAEQGHRRLLEFIDLAHTHGYDRAFQQVYAMTPIEFERRWQGSLLERPARSGNPAVSMRSPAWLPIDSDG